MASGNDFYLSLLDWRNTPTEGLESSPAQRLFGRRTRTHLPTASNLLKPEVPLHVKDKLLKKKEKQAFYYNQGTKELSQLNPGDTVRVQSQVKGKTDPWFKAQVQDQVDVRSYAVRTEDGRMYRRNRRHLRRTPEKFRPKNTIVDEMCSDDSATPVPFSSNSLVTNAPVVPTAPSHPPPKSTTAIVPAAPHADIPPQEQTRISRSGRQIKKPTYLKDFVA